MGIIKFTSTTYDPVEIIKFDNLLIKLVASYFSNAIFKLQGTLLVTSNSCEGVDPLSE